MWQKLQWDVHLEAMGRLPIRWVFETLVHDPAAAFAPLAERLGVDISGIVFKSNMVMQKTSSSEEFARRMACDFIQDSIRTVPELHYHGVPICSAAVASDQKSA